MSVLDARSASGASLCILGAGQLNDVRLSDLLRQYTGVELVDIDPETVVSALARHGVRSSAGCRVHGPLDLTGILDVLSVTPEAAKSAARDLIRTIERRPVHIPGAPFDVTASLGVLTQMLDPVSAAPLAPVDRDAVCVALRDKHLADLLRLTKPGGLAVLVTDVVSTTTAPVLLGARPGDDLEPHMADLVAAGNFFTGTNPYRIVALLEEDERFRDLVTAVRIADPWLWAVTADRQHLTYAIVAQRSKS